MRPQKRKKLTSQGTPDPQARGALGYVVVRQHPDGPGNPASQHRVAVLGEDAEQKPVVVEWEGRGEGGKRVSRGKGGRRQKKAEKAKKTVGEK